MTMHRECRRCRCSLLVIVSAIVFGVSCSEPQRREQPQAIADQPPPAATQPASPLERHPAQPPPASTPPRILDPQPPPENVFAEAPAPLPEARPAVHVETAPAEPEPRPPTVPDGERQGSSPPGEAPAPESPPESGAGREPLKLVLVPVPPEDPNRHTRTKMIDQTDPQTGWLRILEKEPNSEVARASGDFTDTNRISIQTQNVQEFKLDLAPLPLSSKGRIIVRVDNDVMELSRSALPSVRLRRSSVGTWSVVKD